MKALKSASFMIGTWNTVSRVCSPLIDEVADRWERQTCRRAAQLPWNRSEIFRIVVSLHLRPHLGNISEKAFHNTSSC